jgi:hypothetical protein
MSANGVVRRCAFLASDMPTKGTLLVRHSKKSVEMVESPGGISPPGAPRTVRDPLESHGSRCSAVAMT